MDRRNFIKLTAVTGSTAALASCGHPEHELIRFVPDEDIVPGVATWKPGMCPLCRAGCGTIVRVMDGDVEVVRGGESGVVTMSLARKLEGNPAHPISAGKLCARGQAALQITYHPDRITQPLKRNGPRGGGEFKPVTWDEAIAELVARLDALAETNAQASLAYWAPPGASVRRDLIDTFLDRFGATPAASFELFDDDVLRRANLLSFGREQLPTFDLARSRHVVSFGADFLGTWNSPVAQSAAYGQMRQGRSGVRGTFVQIEPRMSLTGASADEWVSVRPGTEGVLALGMARVIIDAKLRRADAAGRAGALIDGWAAGLTAYGPQEVERRTGVRAARIDRLARELADRSPSVALIAGAPLAQTNGLFQALAVNALNALLGAVGEPGGLSFMPEIPSTVPRRRPARPVAATVAAILSAAQPPVQVLLVDDVNPVFGMPAGARVRDALVKVPFIASFSRFLDETSIFADLILPDHSFLESWTDGRPEAGAAVAVATLAPPAMHPLHQTRASTDVLLDVATRLKRPIAPALPGNTFSDVLKAAFATLAGPAGKNGDPDDLWSTAQKQGGWWGPVKDGAGRSADGAARVGGRGPSERVAPKATDPQFDGDPGQYPFHFMPYASQALADGTVAHLPWLQELPDPLTTAMWSSWVEVNPQTASRLGITDGDLVEIGSQHGVVHAPAVVSPGIAPDVIAMPVGQGHETFTRYASGRGANPVKILAPVVEPETGALAWAATRVRVARASGVPSAGGATMPGGADGSLIQFGTNLRERQDQGR